ncbi:MAG: aspartyl protease family protein [Muribaculaceae bacterium]|nr:aspartyl protease family protein [Muribaculaceae bacterium]
MKLSLWALAYGMLILTSCENKHSYIPVDQNDKIEETTIVESSDLIFDSVSQNSFAVPFKQLPSGVKTIHVKFNDTAGFDGIFDTGCSHLLISLQEARSLYKSGTLSHDDLLGIQESSIASGEIMVNQVFNIHEIAITDVNGIMHVLYDIPATVVENLEASILIGNIVIDQFADYNSYSVDLKNNLIVFN